MTIPLQKKLVKTFAAKRKLIGRFAKACLWFSLGAIFGFFFFVSFLYIGYRQMHTNLIYEGVLVNGVDLGGKTTDEVKAYFFQKNKHTQDTTIILTGHNVTATISAKQINFGYDENLLTQQAFSVGRSDNLLSNMSLMLQAYMQGIQLSPAYNYKEDKLNKLLAPLQA